MALPAEVAREVALVAAEDPDVVHGRKATTTKRVTGTVFDGERPRRLDSEPTRPSNCGSRPPHLPVVGHARCAVGQTRTGGLPVEGVAIGKT